MKRRYMSTLFFVYVYLCRIDRSVDISAVLSRLGHHQGSAVHLSKDTIDTDGVYFSLVSNVMKLSPFSSYIKLNVMQLSNQFNGAMIN